MSRFNGIIQCPMMDPLDFNDALKLFIFYGIWSKYLTEIEVIIMP